MASITTTKNSYGQKKQAEKDSHHRKHSVDRARMSFGGCKITVLKYHNRKDRKTTSPKTLPALG